MLSGIRIVVKLDGRSLYQGCSRARPARRSSLSSGRPRAPKSLDRSRRPGEAATLNSGLPVTSRARYGPRATGAGTQNARSERQLRTPGLGSGSSCQPGWAPRTVDAAPRADARSPANSSHPGATRPRPRDGDRGAGDPPALRVPTHRDGRSRPGVVNHMPKGPASPISGCDTAQRLNPRSICRLP